MVIRFTHAEKIGNEEDVVVDGGESDGGGLQSLRGARA
jgi:hypothetical protein